MAGKNKHQRLMTSVNWMICVCYLTRHALVVCLKVLVGARARIAKHVCASQYAAVLFVGTSVMIELVICIPFTPRMKSNLLGIKYTQTLG